MSLFARTPSIYSVTDCSTLDLTISGLPFQADAETICYAGQSIALSEIREWKLDLGGLLMKNQWSSIKCSLYAASATQQIVVPFASNTSQKKGGTGTLKDAWALYRTLREFGYLQVAPRLLPPIVDHVRSGGTFSLSILQVTRDGLSFEGKKGPVSIGWDRYIDFVTPEKLINIKPLLYVRAVNPKDGRPMMWCMLPGHTTNVCVMPGLLDAVSTR